MHDYSNFAQSAAVIKKQTGKLLSCDVYLNDLQTRGVKITESPKLVTSPAKKW